jgi:hypothetical protein
VVHRQTTHRREDVDVAERPSTGKAYSNRAIG